eukprot:2335832-Rhodomonas_salina.1
MWTLVESRLHINVLEALMILQFVEEFSSELRGRRVLGWCDNSTSVAAMNKGSLVSNLITGIVRRTRLICLEHDIWLWIAHIPGVLNIQPDGLSRGVLATRISNWSLIPTIMTRWRKQAGGHFDWDLFCYEGGANSVATVPVEGGATRGLRLWAFPPPELAAQAVADAPGWEAKEVWMLVPNVVEVNEELGWHVAQVYGACARIFMLPVAGHFAHCKGAGLAMKVVRLTSPRS